MIRGIAYYHKLVTVFVEVTSAPNIGCPRQQPRIDSKKKNDSIIPQMGCIPVQQEKVCINPFNSIYEFLVFHLRRKYSLLIPFSVQVEGDRIKAINQ